MKFLCSNVPTVGRFPQWVNLEKNANSGGLYDYTDPVLITLLHEVGVEDLLEANDFSGIKWINSTKSFPMGFYLRR